MSEVAAYAHLKGIRLHISGRLTTAVARPTAASAGHDVHAGTVCIPGPDCELSEIEPDTESGVCVLGNSLSDSTIHLSPLDGQVEAAIDTVASCQEFKLSLCEAVDEARWHADVNGLSGALGQIASETNTTQFSRSLGQEKALSVSADFALAKRLACSELVVLSIEHDGRPDTGAIRKRSVDLH